MKSKKPKFQIGEKVRISKFKKTFEKGFTPNWTEEIFVVDKIIYTHPITYKLVDLSGEEITGSFYEEEMQKTNQKTFRIKEILEKGEKSFLVKWKGYSDKFNSWIPNEWIE